MAILLLLIEMASMMMVVGRKRKVAMRNHRIELLVTETHQIVDTLVQKFHEKLSLARNTHLIGLLFIGICNLIEDHLLIFHHIDSHIVLL